VCAELRQTTEPIHDDGQVFSDRMPFRRARRGRVVDDRSARTIVECHVCRGERDARTTAHTLQDYRDVGYVRIESTAVIEIDAQQGVKENSTDNNFAIVGCAQ
jgi:hypothetical protein